MGKRSKARWLRTSLSLISLAVLFKLVLALGPAVLKEPDKFSTAEVLAGDQKDKASESSSAKAAGSAKDVLPTPSAGVKSDPGSRPTETYAFIQQKEAELKRKEEQLRAKEEYLSKMEREVEQKLKELIAVQKEIQTYRAEKEENQNGKVRSLAKIYGTMKPKEAAKLLENLDEKLVMSVIATMNSDEAAGILSNMDVKKAAKISEALCHR